MPAMKALAYVMSVSLLLVGGVALADAGSDGGAIFKSNCAICHCVDGRGQTPTGRALKVNEAKPRENRSFGGGNGGGGNYGGKRW